MALDAFSAPGRFYKGNLHTHSTLSDGALDPEEVCRQYQAQGYDFIALTDHFTGAFGYPIADTKAFRGADFTTILGAEVHSGSMQNGEIWHLLAIGLEEDFRPPNVPTFVPVSDQETGAQLAQRARDAGAFVAVAHPQWSGMTLEDARSITAAHAVEIYNHGCAVDCDRADGFHTADLLLSEGRRLNLIATDDAHFSTPDAFGGWVMVKAEDLTPEALLSGLKDGNFYSSQGPELHGVRLTDTGVEVECSPVGVAILQGVGSPTTTVRGDDLTKCTLPFNRLEASPWVRVTVIDEAGKRAWSNPIWRDAF